MINEHNYEDFFLRYADGDLCAEEKMLVEAFVRRNKEYQSILDSYLQTILVPETVKFSDASFLIKKESLPGNMQEKLLLHIDGELGSEALILQKEIDADETLLAEWTLLQQTKLQDEKFVFENKELLYKKAGRIVQLWFMRAAVAAAFIGICFFAGYQFTNKDGGKDVAGVNDKTPQQPYKVDQVIDVKEGTKAPVLYQQREKDLATKTKINKVEAAAGDQEELTKSKHSDQQESVAKTGQEGVKRNRDKYIPNQVLQPNESIVAANSNATPAFTRITGAAENITVVNAEDILQKDKLQKNVVAMLIDENLSAAKNSFATHASTNEYDTESNTRILYFDSKKIENTKLGELYKKAKKVVDKSRKVKTGRSIQIANFEIRI